MNYLRFREMPAGVAHSGNWDTCPVKPCIECKYTTYWYTVIRQKKESRSYHHFFSFWRRMRGRCKWYPTLNFSWWQLDLFPRWTRSFSLCATQAFQKIAVAMIQSKGLAVDMTCCTFSIFVFKNPWCNRMWKLIWLSIPSIRLAVVPSPHELSGKKKSHYIRWHDYVFVAPGAL